jgi:hypothetical protein
MKKTTIALTVPASIHTSDHAKRAQFDAGEWLAAAPVEKIVQLAESGWGGCDTSEEIARFALRGNDAIADVFQYAMYVRHGGSSCTCRCYVDWVSALEWLASSRPDVLEAIRSAQRVA